MFIVHPTATLIFLCFPESGVSPFLNAFVNYHHKPEDLSPLLHKKKRGEYASPDQAPSSVIKRTYIVDCM
ncbi:unnamed protein product [Peronospora farinosa]|uniref:Uncharacterized protein n=1 Tax=Peronospora farinosa TaxID=134698 RepID=A0ABN8CBT8_9STRA|nr:unnamed protein product [Peronospora farinosa]